MSAQVLKQLSELKQIYRDQYFNFTSDQQQKYNELLNRRREIVKNSHDNDRVSTSSKPLKNQVKKQSNGKNSYMLVGKYFMKMYMQSTEMMLLKQQRKEILKQE